MRRALEILPGALSWGTLIALVLFSWKLPLAVAIFIVLYDLFWMLRTVYFTIHLRSSFNLMQKNMGMDWLQKLRASGKPWEHIAHAAVFTIYKEPHEVVRESVLSLTKTNFPLKNIILVLALEERGGDADVVMAKKVLAEFGAHFKHVLITIHPASIPDEVAGKASNEAWAVRRMYEDLVRGTDTRVEDVLVSVFDADVTPTKDYFGILTHTFLNTPNALHAGYQPVVVFSNAYHVPIFARLLGFSCSFWGLIQQGHPEMLMTFSCYSMPLKALVDVGFWNTNVIAEDARIFYQCLDRYAGDWRVVPLHYPVTMEAISGDHFLSAAGNLYKQQRRWAWGVENIPFVVTSFIKNKKFPWRAKLYWISNIFETFHSWAVSSLVIFLAGILPNVLGGAEFHTSVASYNLPKITSFLMNMSVFGLITSAVFSIFLLSPKIAVKNARWYHSAYYVAQWVFAPLAFIIFGAFPALESQTRLMLGGKFRLGYWNTPRAAREPQA